MNVYKQRKEEYLKKQFPYLRQFKNAIHSSDAIFSHFEMVRRCDIKQVRNLDNPRELARILDQCEFNLMASWSYRYQHEIIIYDWASLYWTPSGLHIHFEWISTCDESISDNSDVEMTKAMWKFFMLQRRKIFKQFYPELTLQFVENEDFAVQITDHDLNFSVQPVKR